MFGATRTAENPHLRVLWYSYAHPQSEYRRKIEFLADSVHKLPESQGIRWRISWFGPDWPQPQFEKFDVLVIQSGEGFRSGPPDVPTMQKVDFSAILRYSAAIARARGSRTVLSGADADFHALGGATGNAPKRQGFVVRCNPPLVGKACWDGALGHMVNAINWAGRGGGLGVVSFVAAEFPGSQWWLHGDSFLLDELTKGAANRDSVIVFGPGKRENQAEIPAFAAKHALNAGMTSKGMGDWNHSFHAGFSRSIPGYFSFVDSVRYPGLAVAIASERSQRR